MSTRDSIRSFIVDTFFVDEFGDDDSFLRKGLIDSTGMMELVAFVESEFGIKLEDKELVPENLDSLSRVVAFVGRKQALAKAS
ncbi:acyl carrier protein [Corallococcus sp. H22C18031201]|uniref:acyl carrier protein n=1 Tax=Citreicoccus inhibens TaxID=2849499 RepID=UPI000E7337F4|nr:acyl carrier protein [Citreicoccus inhibens]MBU8899958.1 acyl carrier protein [Citreicoccus inhibens]RJS27903.1 acyl carrier protein [Corallococcus sp. H22C18031201]